LEPLTAAQLTVAPLEVMADDERLEGCPHAGGVPPIVKFTFEISKKIFPTASTFTLHEEPGLLGTDMFSVPSLAVFDASVMGKVLPPSVESKMFTLVQLTGATLVPFTLHVTVCDVPTAQLTAVLGAVTANGPAALEIVTLISSLWLLAPPARLSLTVKRKFNVLATEGSTSHLLVLVPSSIELNTGNVLVLFVVCT
jgi:hypothetical protein